MILDLYLEKSKCTRSLTIYIFSVQYMYDRKLAENKRYITNKVINIL